MIEKDAIARCPSCKNWMHKEMTQHDAEVLVCGTCGAEVPLSGGNIIINGEVKE